MISFLSPWSCPRGGTLGGAGGAQGGSIFYAPTIYNGGGHIASPLSVHPYVCTSRPIRMKNGFWAISFEYIGVLDSYFIHRYIIINCRTSLITDKIHQLLSELWPLISE